MVISMKTRRVDHHVLEICDDHNTVVFSIAEEMKNENTMRIQLAGEITNDVAHEFEDEVMAALSVCPKIELDFAKVSYIASMALKALLSIQQIMDEMENSQMVLTHVPQKVMDILKETGFCDILWIEEE